MACSCLLLYLDPDKGCFLCCGRVSAIFDCSCELLGCHAPFCLDWDAVYSHVFEECGCGVRAWGYMIELVWASFLYTRLKKIYCSNSNC